MSLKDILVISDMDGTLMTKEFFLPKYNVEKINEFISKGGNFTLATGRSYASAVPYVGSYNLIFPVVLFNGGMIYDFNKKEILYQRVLDNSSYDLITYIMNNYPDVGVEVADATHMHIIKNNDHIIHHTINANAPYKFSKLNNDYVWNKVLFTDTPEQINKLHEELSQIKQDAFDIVKSADVHIEFLPKGINKGEGVKKLCEITGFDISRVYCVGDYYNDFEMLKVAGTAVCPENAPDDIKNICNIVTGPVEEGAVGQLLDKIMKEKG